MAPFDLIDRALYPVEQLLSLGTRWGWGYFITGFLAAAYVYWRFAERGVDGDAAVARERGLLRFLFPREIWLHPSACLDYALFVLNKILITFVLAAVATLSEFSFLLMRAGLAVGLGPPQDSVEPSLALTLLTTLVVVVVFDFGLWFSHWLMHKIPLLWEFHKIHHSAEVMTPFSAARVHPVDETFGMATGAVCGGLAYGAMSYGLGPAAIVLSLFQINVILVAFYGAAFVLRHSHVWLAYPNWLQHVLISPAQHQIHHSIAERHWDRNMGFIFAFWDWAAGTLYAPKTYERLTYGLNEAVTDGADYKTLGGAYLTPFRRVWRMLRRARGRAADAPPAPRAHDPIPRPQRTRG